MDKCIRLGRHCLSFDLIEWISGEGLHSNHPREITVSQSLKASRFMCEGTNLISLLNHAFSMFLSRKPRTLSFSLKIKNNCGRIPLLYSAERMGYWLKRITFLESIRSEKRDGNVMN
jgi:hypothetical protein